MLRWISRGRQKKIPVMKAGNSRREGWKEWKDGGIGTSPRDIVALEALDVDQPTRMVDWESVTLALVDTQMSRQTSIQESTEKKEKLTNIIPEGRKDVKPAPKTSQRRRMKGKLTKKEQRVMKKTHMDIGWLLASPPTPEIMNH